MNRTKLYNAAVSFVGKNAHLDDLADYEVACADSVDTVCRAGLGMNVGCGAPTASTALMYELLLSSKNQFIEVDAPENGDIIIAPTGYQTTADGHGHVGIFGLNDLIYSNNSNTGLWDTHLNAVIWAEMFQFTRYFRAVDPVSHVTTQTPLEMPITASQTPSPAVVAEEKGILQTLLADLRQLLTLMGVR